MYWEILHIIWSGNLKELKKATSSKSIMWSCSIFPVQACAYFAKLESFSSEEYFEVETWFSDIWVHGLSLGSPAAGRLHLHGWNLGACGSTARCLTYRWHTPQNEEGSRRSFFVLLLQLPEGGFELLRVDCCLSSYERGSWSVVR